MPISLTEAKKRTASVDVYREVEHVGFKPGDLIVKYHVQSSNLLDDEARAQAIADREDPEELKRLYLALLVETIVEWDLSLEPGGKPIPITQEELARCLPSEMVMDIIQAIGRHKRPGEYAGRKSRGR